MAGTPGSPLKKFINSFRRTKKGGNDEEVPLPSAQSGSIGPRGVKRIRGGDDGADDDDDTRAEEFRGTPRSARMLATGLSASMSASMNPDRISIFQSTPERDEIDKYGEDGVRFENYMANINRSGEGSGIARSTLTLDDLHRATHRNQPLFNIPEPTFTHPPAEIRVALESTNLPQDPTENRYRRVRMWRNKYRKVSTYEHYIVPGAIIGVKLERKEGPYWSDIALALYKSDASINTLRYVFMLHVKNDETLPLVAKVLYKQHRLPGGPDDSSTTPIVKTWHMRTPEFEQILGTQLGRSVSRLVLAAWRPGTHHIPEIHTWFVGGKLHMRFDIERISSAAASGSAGTR